MVESRQAPAVSIVLPTYDRLDYLKEAVQSVQSQTITDWELIIVDDGSRDATVAWVESLTDPRIQLIRCEHTANRAHLRNRGISVARARWIGFLDSDDRWRPHKLERQLAYHAAYPGLRWSYTGRSLIDAEGRESVDPRRKQWVPHAGWIVQPLLQLDATIALPGVLVERALLQDMGGFDETRLFVEDYELWLRLAQRAECGLIDEPLIEVRAHQSTSAGRPEVDLGFMEVHRRFAATTPDPALREIARQQEAFFAMRAAGRWTDRREWARAAAALGTALRRRPADPRAYRGAARLVWRMLRAVINRSSARAA